MPNSIWNYLSRENYSEFGQKLVEILFKQVSGVELNEKESKFLFQADYNNEIEVAILQQEVTTAIA